MILVIDDSPKVITGLELAFPEYRFATAPSGEDGLKYLRKAHEIDLVILDYKLDPKTGGMNGIDVLKEIRRMDPKIGVVLMTSFGSKEVAVEALRAQADDFVDKPFVVEDLKRKLENFFEKRAVESGTAPGSNPMQRIQKFVERNFRKGPTLRDAAEKTMLSPKYISRKFKEETHQTFSDYKVKLRMEQAKKLLSGTSLGVAQVAYKIGYENAESFMKMFKKVVGCTPTEYRQKHDAG